MQRLIEHLLDGSRPIDDGPGALAGGFSAAAFIFSSTYAASSAMYAGSRALRIGYRWPWMKTGTTRSDESDTFQAAGCRLRSTAALEPPNGSGGLPTVACRLQAAIRDSARRAARASRRPGRGSPRARRARW